jgi:hypothetical protein
MTIGDEVALIITTLYSRTKPLFFDNDRQSIDRRLSKTTVDLTGVLHAILFFYCSLRDSSGALHLRFGDERLLCRRAMSLI